MAGRVLLVTRNLPPLVGGMERLNWHMVEELSRTAEVRVVGPAGSAALAPRGVAISEVPLTPLPRFLFQAQFLALREALKWRPDWVLAGSGLTSPAALFAARASGARAATYVHGLDLATVHPLYRSIWRPVLRRMDRVIANSEPTRRLAQHIGIAPERIGVVHPGVQEPSASAEAKWDYRAANGLGDRPILVSVGRLSARKGLREFVEHSLPQIVAQLPDILLIVVGDSPRNALSATEQSKESIEATAGNAGVGDHVRFLGGVSDFELSRILRAADIHVFPVRDIRGDPEGFGMVAIEAAAHGVPTVAFASGGTVDAVADGRSGRLVKAGDYESFAAAVIEVYRGRASLTPSCMSFVDEFAWPKFGTRIVRELQIARHRVGLPPA